MIDRLRAPVRGARQRRGSALLLSVAATVFASIVAVTGVTAQVSASGEGLGVAGFRRLNEAQYRRSIEQIFGAGIKVPGRFDPPLREQGLLAIGDGRVSVSLSGVEQFELRGREIAAQVLSGDHATDIIPCKLPAPDTFDAACARAFLGKYGRLLYRRPLAADELASVVAMSASGARVSHGFAKGLEIGLSRLLVSPNFIFRIERFETPAQGGPARLDDYALATRISFLLWDAPPDDALLDAAARGDLRDAVGLAAQVDRLMASPRYEQGVRSFFADMLGYENFRGLAKDQAIYPKFNSALAADAQEQALRTIVDLLVRNHGDYRDLFTTRKTFMNRGLAALYQVPVSAEAVEGWAPFTFAQDSHRGGLLSLAGFLMLDPTHEGRSSPTIRGKSIRELLLCQPVPMPPPNVNFAIVQDVTNPQYRTARQRLTAHQENPACAGCHALTDPLGLSLENYDALGNYRSQENGATIDVTGRFDGKNYDGLSGLSVALHDSPDVPACLVQRVFEYGLGREATGQDSRWLEPAVQQFAQDGYRLPGLMRRIAISPGLASIPAPAPANLKTATR